MSDFFLRLAPIEPTFVPESSRIRPAESLLRAMLPQAESVSTFVFECIQFIDAGGNWEGVSCSACSCDAEPWWSDAMSEAFESKFQSLLVQAPCCGHQVSLSKLDYGWPVAFARFMIEVRNPAVQELSTAQLEQLGALLGFPLAQVKAHV